MICHFLRVSIVGALGFAEARRCSCVWGAPFILVVGVRLFVGSCIIINRLCCLSVMVNHS